MLAEASDKVSERCGFVYDERTGMYYDQSSRLYYDQVRRDWGGEEANMKHGLGEGKR